VQTPLQIEVLRNIIQELRDGCVPSVPKFEKVIFVSHSYGSIVARLIATVHPDNGADAYVLTAASSNLTGLTGAVATWNPRSASAVDSRFPNLNPAYLSISPGSVRDTIYPLDGQFDPKMAEWDAQSPHVFALGEISASSGQTPSDFKGPVLVLTGRVDQIVCGNGNITSLVPDCGVGPGSNPDKTRSLFPKASLFETYVPGDSAHSLNTQYSAPETFGAALEWLQSVGF
jgi:pimeloyl-ACP methyl ester carboxylesterase